MKTLNVILALCLVSAAFGQEKQWKRVADLPDYDEKDLINMGDGGTGIPTGEGADPAKELEDIFNKLNPGANQDLGKEQYKELLKDLILGANRKDVENQGSESIAAIQHKLLGSIIDEYVDLETKDTNNMQDLLADLEQEKLLSYIDKMYKKKLDNMEL